MVGWWKLNSLWRENRHEFMGVRMAAGQIDFWFAMGSTYSFLSVMRLEEEALHRRLVALAFWSSFRK
jgi:hypothetical protein